MIPHSSHPKEEESPAGKARECDVTEELKRNTAEQVEKLS
jgi:hypothetical protein